LIYNGAGEGNRILSENVHNSLNCPIIVHCKRHIFHHLRIKRQGDDQTLMQIDASANVISRPCALVRSYHNPANLRVKTEILSARRKGRGASRPARAELESMRSCPLARAWAGVKPSAGAWGRRKSPTTEKRLNRCQSSRVSVFDG
jgi:hypothetical protein